MPLHLQLLVKWEVVSPNSIDIGNFIMRLEILKSSPFTYWLNERWFLQIIDIHVGNFDMKSTGRWFPQIVDRDRDSPIYIYVTTIIVLVSEPVRGRSRATELPCFQIVDTDFQH